jgi:hypothetical protein
MVVASASLECRPAAEVPAGVSVEFLDAAEAPGRNRWLDLWTSWPGREIMAHPDYVRLFARPQDRVIAAALRTASGGILYPVIVRPIASEPWASPGARGCDLSTAYGYGGPFAWSVTPEDARTFWLGFDAWAATLGVATSFARLSLFSGQLLPWNGDTVSGGPNVVRRVDTTDEALWNDYRCEARRHIDIAREQGVTIEFDGAGRRLEEFLEIYTSTMDRRGASKNYYFPRAFFAALQEKLSGHFTFVHAVLGGRVVSSEILLLAAEHAYSFLGGTRAEAFRAGPNYLLKHECFRWSRAQGKKAVVLGGGYQAGDGILKFKQRFGRASEVPFLLGQKTYDAAEARRLVECRRTWERAQGRDWIPAPEFYPEYRA